MYMEDRKKIILADDAARLSIGKSALDSHFEVLTVPSSEKLFQALRVFRPALILLDVDMPGTNGFETLRLLKTEPETAEIPIILLSAGDGHASHERGLALGAADFVIKPYTAVLLINLIRRHVLLAAQRKQIERHKEAVELLAARRRSSLLHLQDSLLDILISLSRKTARMLPQFRAPGIFAAICPP
jgi:putative two-component system response regulator